MGGLFWFQSWIRNNYLRFVYPPTFFLSFSMLFTFSFSLCMSQSFLSGMHHSLGVETRSSKCNCENGTHMVTKMPSIWLQICRSLFARTLWNIFSSILTVHFSLSTVNCQQTIESCFQSNAVFNTKFDAPDIPSQWLRHPHFLQFEHRKVCVIFLMMSRWSSRWKKPKRCVSRAIAQSQRPFHRKWNCLSLFDSFPIDKQRVKKRNRSHNSHFDETNDNTNKYYYVCTIYFCVII